MNNAQFRKLVLDTPRREGGGDSDKNKNGSNPAATPSLGSRQRSMIPMTPRSVGLSGQNEFARQLAARKLEEAQSQPTKKFRATAAPKGTKFTEGYVDRTKLREEEEKAEDAEERLKAIIEAARDPKTGKVNRDLVIEQSRLLGGDVNSTHLVRGLDFALLAKVKRGEDVMGLKSEGKKGNGETGGENDGPQEEDFEEELDKVLEKAIVPAKKEEKPKKVGHKVTREDMLAELKRQKAEAAAKKTAMAPPPVPSLGSRFKKIGEKKEKKEKERKKKKRKVEEKESTAAQQPLGMLPPPLPASKVQQPAYDEEDDDFDIFDGAGRDYDPLAGLQDDDDDNDSGSDGEARPSKPESATPDTNATASNEASSSLPPPPQPTSKPKINYFNEPDSDTTDSYQPPSNPAALLSSDPNLAAFLAKASKLAESSVSAEEKEKEERRKAMLANVDRDAMDLDMGFGGSRDWGEDEEEFVEQSGGAKKRKRGKGPKKGDKNNAELIGKMVKEKYGDK